ncbi:hypothetical protein GBAR_LOCUS14583 [Geodia barretti]|uniref:Uncharacterized protein n=2 Tax=Geodia barretti TaxID=519541 RepID=A0AA35WKV8_GEOBA|nr:hypothetical protein GBAR_LOCUS14583 [Geodia barretti]
MQLEWKVIRLELRAIDTNYSYLLGEMSPDEVVPHLVQRSLLTRAQAEVWERSSQLEKVSKIVDALRDADNRVVGMFPTFCMALNDSGMSHVSETLRNKFQSLLIGEAISHQQEEDEIMISGESSTQPSPPPDSRLFTAQLEGSTLTRAQYNTIHSLTSSFLRIPTSDLVYDGHTLNPLSLHWHCSTAENLFGTLPLLTEMAMTQIRNIALPSGKLTIPQLNVRNYASVITVYYFN